MERYPLYSTLLVLEEYEKNEIYEECAIIRDALKKYKDKYESKFPNGLKLPMHASVYRGKKCQDMMEKYGIAVEEKEAKEKATLIKLKLPL